MLVSWKTIKAHDKYEKSVHKCVIYIGLQDGIQAQRLTPSEAKYEIVKPYSLFSFAATFKSNLAINLGAGADSTHMDGWRESNSKRQREQQS